VWLEKDHCDPFSGEPLPSTQLFPNILARQLADEFRAQQHARGVMRSIGL